MRKHTKWVTSLSWEPMHRYGRPDQRGAQLRTIHLCVRRLASNAACERLVSASKDFTAIVWNVRTSRMEFSLSVRASRFVLSGQRA